LSTTPSSSSTNWLFNHADPLSGVQILKKGMLTEEERRKNLLNTKYFTIKLFRTSIPWKAHLKMPRTTTRSQPSPRSYLEECLALLQKDWKIGTGGWSNPPSRPHYVPKDDIYDEILSKHT